MSATHLEVTSSREGDGEPVDYVTPLAPLPGVRIDTVMAEELEDVIVEEIPNIKIGICAMNKKTKSPPMQEILSRIMRFDFVDIVMFTDDIIKSEPIENWPVCDALISFYSTGFPLDKAIEYAKLRKPFVLNDLEMQYVLLDRCAVYKRLEEANIETPRYAILIRDEFGEPLSTDFVELEDSIQIGDITFQKPFVEKPIDAENHNVFIYYPSSAGGGSQRLFRKVGSRSSVYSAESCVRKFGSYLYEDFVPTDGTDVKVYTVGPEYAHAEARKSPSLDGKVERDSQGKEIRYPVILNPYEKEIAHKVCELFKQTVCGFDLLRTHGKSYVCDVNGFSFVKTSKKYYDDCAQTAVCSADVVSRVGAKYFDKKIMEVHVLVSSILQELAPQLYKPYNLDQVDQEDRPVTETLNGTMLELRCVIGIIRHGDRTPKQKMKMEARDPRFIQLFKRYSSSSEKKLKLKRPKQLQEILDIARELLEDAKGGAPLFENPNKLHQLKNVLEMYGHFSGINRKIQLKYLGPLRDNPDSSGNEEKHQKKGYESENEKMSCKDKEKKNSKESKEGEALLLIMKWGGELTSAGRTQAEELGRAFRCMYPGGHGEYSSLPGCGLLRLHSTYRHDLKIYASDEGRVQMTAAAFAKGFLALEGELTPILVHLVRSDKNTTEMLDTSDKATKIMARVKHKLHDILHQDRSFTDDDKHKLAPTKATSLIEAMKIVQNPREMCIKLRSLVHSLTAQLKEMISQKVYDPRDPFLYHDETLELMTHRWNKLDKDFRLKDGKYDISLIPDIYDSIKYDVQHNSKVGLKNSQELYNCAKSLADIVIPQEYGLTPEDKVNVSQRVCLRLLKKIRGDLKHADMEDTYTRLNPKYSQSVITPHRHVRTRLYFTSESHVHSVINAFRFGQLFEVCAVTGSGLQGEFSGEITKQDTSDPQWNRAVQFLSEVPELNYMTQIVLMLYEDPTADLMSENRFHIELHFSPGAKTLDGQSRGQSAEPKASRPVPSDTSSPPVQGDNPIPSDQDPTRPNSDRKDIKSVKQESSGAQGNVEVNVDTRTDKLFSSVECYLDQAVLTNTSTTDSTLVESRVAKDGTASTDTVEGKTEKPEMSPSPDVSSRYQQKLYRSPLYQDDNTFEGIEYTYHERPRCSIGMDDFSDPNSSPISLDKMESFLSGGMNQELQCEVRRIGSGGTPTPINSSSRRISLSESNIRDASSFTEKLAGEGTNCKDNADAVGRRSSESDALCPSEYHGERDKMPHGRSSSDPTGVMACGPRSNRGSQCEPLTVMEETDRETEEGISQRSLQRSRSRSVSDLESSSASELELPTRSNSDSSESRQGDQVSHSCPASHPTSAKSDSTVENRRRLSAGVLPVRNVQSSPTFKKAAGLRRSPVRGGAGSVFYLPAILAVSKKLTMTAHGVYRVRPLSLTKTDSKMPPIADFYTEGTIGASLNPLQTLHNSIPLKSMDQFLDRMTEEVTEESDVSTTNTPATTPTRKAPSKKLALKTSTHKNILPHNDSVVGLEGLDLSELTMDTFEKSSPES